jgi:ribosomal protein S27AE
MTKLKQAKCPACGSSLHSKGFDRIFVCDKCGIMHAIDREAIPIDNEAGAFIKEGAGEKVYLPFWKVSVDFKIKQESVKGGLIHKISKFLGGDKPYGTIDMMLPAFDIGAKEYKKVAEKLTIDKPLYTPSRIDPSIRRLPCEVTYDMIDKMADFLFMTLEAGKPGVMQNIEYELKINSKKMVYLPFYLDHGELTPGF